MPTKSIFTAREAVFGVVCCALFTSAVVAGFAQREPDWYNLLFGSIGLLPFVATAATLFMLVVNSRHADRTFAQSLVADRAGRYQKAAELLSREQAGAQIAGIALLRQVAIEDAGFVSPILQTLRGFITGLNEIQVEIDKFGHLGGKTEFTFSSPAALDALIVVGELSPRVRDRGEITNMLDEDGRLVLTDVFLCGYDDQKVNLPRTHIRYGVFDSFGFIDSDFTGTKFDCAMGEDVGFTRCNLAGAKFEVTTWQGRLITPADVSIIEFNDCTGVETATINNMTLAHFLEQRRSTAKR